MASNNVMNLEADPEYITYLFNPKDDYDWYFVVGNGKNNTPVERIGVVKKMLLARSEVFRRELHESKLKEKNDTKITDIFPSTFRNLLRFLYGFDNTASLSFDDADDLLYAADKYMVEKLKANLASRLMDLLSYENICSLLNNPACYRELELNAKITKILQFETRKVLASPQFPDLCAKAFLTILEQEKLQVSEIELWRSAVQWAKNKANSDEGADLRKELTTHLKHIRVCTVSHEDFCREIVQTNVLTDSEGYEICLYLGNKDHKPRLTEICDSTQPRTVAQSFIKSDLVKLNNSNNSSGDFVNCNVLTFDISTVEHYIELCSLTLYNYKNSSHDYTVEIRQVNNAKDPFVSVSAQLQSPTYTIDLPSSNDDDDGYVVLQPNSRYRVTVSSSAPIYMCYCNSILTGNHFKVYSFTFSGNCYSCITSFNYRVGRGTLLFSDGHCEGHSGLRECGVGSFERGRGEVCLLPSQQCCSAQSQQCSGQ